MKELMKKHVIREEEGSVIILALLVLVILTLIGIGVLTSSSSDLMVSRNESIYRRNFSMAEAAARLGAMEVRNARHIPIDDQPDTTEFDDSDLPYWLHYQMPVENDITDPLNWADTASAPVMGNNEVRFLVRYDGPEGTVDATGGETTYPYRFTIFGRSNVNGGEVIVQMGYILIMSVEEET